LIEGVGDHVFLTETSRGERALEAKPPDPKDFPWHRDVEFGLFATGTKVMV